MKFWCWKKHIQFGGTKTNYLFYLMLGNKVITKLGYSVYNPKFRLVRINYSKLLYFIYLYKGSLDLTDDIYINFFFLYYFYLTNRNKALSS